MPQTRIQNWVELLEMHAQTRPDALSFAYLQDGLAVSSERNFGQLYLRAKAIAAELQARNLAGERALLLFPNDLNYIEAFLGCLLAGVVAVPVYPPQMSRQVGRMMSILQDSGARVMLASRMVLSMIKAQAPEILAGGEDRWIATDEITDDKANEWNPFSPNADHLAFLQYTSGSTGTPKGVMITHGNLLHNQTVIQHLFQSDESMVGVGWLPLYHDMGLIGNVLHSLYMGTPLYLMSPLTFLQKPFHWLKAIDRYRGTTSGGPNFAYEYCVKKITDEQLAELDLSSWKNAFCGAEPINPHTLRKFADRFERAGFQASNYLPCYGMAETTLAVSGLGGNHSDPTELQISASALRDNRVVESVGEKEETQTIVGVGPVGPGLTTCIVDADSQMLGENEIGEIWVQGESVAKGYWQQTEKTQETFGALTTTGDRPFLRTGDLGFMYQGELFITGRLKDLIIIRGKNHYPQDIELTVANANEQLRAGGGVAVAIPGEQGEELLILQEVNGKKIAEAEGDKLIARIREAVTGEHEVRPHTIVLLPRKSILKTSSGKVQRQPTKAAYLKGRLEVLAISAKGDTTPEASLESPQTDTKTLRSADEIQQWIIRWMAAKLQMNPADIYEEDPVNVYGVDSMMVQEFETEISAFVGFTWPVSDLLLTEPSIREIAQRGADLAEEEISA